MFVKERLKSRRRQNKTKILRKLQFYLDCLNTLCKTKKTSENKHVFSLALKLQQLHPSDQMSRRRVSQTFGVSYLKEQSPGGTCVTSF